MGVSKGRIKAEEIGYLKQMWNKDKLSFNKKKMKYMKQ